MTEQFVEYFEWRARRGMLELDVAVALIADYRARATAVSERQAKPLSVPRPKPIKHWGTTDRAKQEGRLVS